MKKLILSVFLLTPFVSNAFNTSEAGFLLRLPSIKADFEEGYFVPTINDIINSPNASPVDDEVEFVESSNNPRGRVPQKELREVIAGTTEVNGRRVRRPVDFFVPGR